MGKDKLLVDGIEYTGIDDYHANFNLGCSVCKNKFNHNDLKQINGLYFCKTCEMGKVGFDLHGVLTESPHIFREILRFMMNMGYEIHIISGPPLDEIEAELERLGYIRGEHYHKVFSMSDYIRFSDSIESWSTWNDDQGRMSWWCSDDEWWKIKGLYCEEEGIKIVFDDKHEYRDHMPEGTKYYLVPQHKDVKLDED